MTNEVLCAIDFSDSSKEALKWSIRFAQKLNSHLTILYTYRIFKHNGEAIIMKRKIEEEAIKNFSALEKEVLIGEGISYDFKTEIGFIADRVEDHVKKNNVSFLVISKNMTTQSKETLDELVAHLRAPLVIVP